MQLSSILRSTSPASASTKTPAAFRFAYRSLVRVVRYVAFTLACLLASHIALAAPRSVSSSAQLVPIRTRVLVPGTVGRHAVDYGIQVGDATTGGVRFYRAHPTGGPAPGLGGFQVLLLDRNDLHRVSNTSFSVFDDISSSIFDDSLTNLYTNNPTCQADGCIEIIQSLNKLGYSPCLIGSLQACVQVEQTPNMIGSSSPFWLANGQLTDNTGGVVGYSYIGTGVVSGIGVPPGAFYDHLSCRATSGCGGTGDYSLNATAPAGAPADELGAISGVLVRNAAGKFVFTTKTPRLSYASQTTESASTITIGSEQIQSIPLPAGSHGGFHLVIVDAHPTGTSLPVLVHETYSVDYIPPSQLPAGMSNLSSLPADIATFNSRGNLFFLASFGSLNHSGAYGNTGYRASDIWDGVGEAVLSLGGDYRTFEQLNLVPPGANAPTHQDDYFLVGRHGSLYSVHPVAEASTLISRQTVAQPPASSNTAGFLKVDHEGYYAPSQGSGYAGFAPAVAIRLAAASTQPNAFFPLNGPGDPAGLQAAYSWFCALLGVTDLRAQYTNADATFSAYFAEVINATWNPAGYAGTSHPQVGFTEADFNTAQTQLKTELTYVESIYAFQGNVHSFIDSQAIINADEFNSVQSQVASFFDVQPSSSVHGKGWVQIVNDFLTIAGPVVGAGTLSPATAPFAVGIDSAFAIATVILDTSADETENHTGIPWATKEKELIQASKVANQAATEFVATLTAFDLQTQRILSDWNRLRYEGTTLASFSWSDVAADQALNPYIIAVRRQLFTSLIATNYSVLHYIYSAPDNNIKDGLGYYENDVVNLCVLHDFTEQVGPLATAFFPGNQIDGSSPTAFPSTHHSPHDKWWDVWAIGQNGFKQNCPRTYDFRDTESALKNAQVLSPLQPGTGNLGLYQSYLFTSARSGIPVIDSSLSNTYWVQPVDYNHDRKLYPDNGDDDFH